MVVMHTRAATSRKNAGSTRDTPETISELLLREL